MLNAALLNRILAAGGTVTIVNPRRVTPYGKKHAGMFSEGEDGNLYVVHGRGKHCLSMNAGKMLLNRIDCTLPDHIDADAFLAG